MAEQPSSDHELLDRYLDCRSQAAFTALVQRHLNLVYYTALRRVAGEAALAEEVTQTVFLALAAKAAQARRRPVLASWLYQSTRLAAAQAVRGESRRRHREAQAYVMKTLIETPDQDWSSMAPLLGEALDKLSARDREAILLRFFENQSFGEIGARLSLSSDAARMRVDRAVEKLRRSLAQRGLVSTASAIAAGFLAQAGQAAPLGLAERTVAQIWSQAGAGVAVATGFSTLLAPVAWKTAAALVLVGAGSAVMIRQLASYEAPATIVTSAPAPESALPPVPPAPVSTSPPAQQKKLDPDPGLALSLDERTLAADQLRSSPMVRDRVGSVQHVQLLRNRRATHRQIPQHLIVGYTGEFLFRVTGAKATAVFLVGWSRMPSNTAPKITSLELVQEGADTVP